MVRKKTIALKFIMHKEVLDIDDELTELWEKVYDAIVDIVDNKYAREYEIELSDSLLVKSLIVTYDGFIKLSDVHDVYDFIEQFEDEYIYDIYNSLSVR